MAEKVGLLLKCGRMRVEKGKKEGKIMNIKRNVNSGYRKRKGWRIPHIKRIGRGGIHNGRANAVEICILFYIECIKARAFCMQPDGVGYDTSNGPHGLPDVRALGVFGWQR